MIYVVKICSSRSAIQLRSAFEKINLQAEN